MVYNRTYLQRRQIIKQIAARNNGFHCIVVSTRQADDNKSFTFLLSLRWIHVLLGAVLDRYSSERVSCLKASATFFSSLRTNLILDDQHSIMSPSSPAPAASSTTTLQSGDATPPFSIYTTTDPSDREFALRLVADSVAQQRQIAAKSLLLHPLILASSLALLAWGYQILLPRGLGAALCTLSGLTMLLLVGVRGVTSPYIAAAEAIKVDLLAGREVVVAKYGEQVVSAAIWGWIDGGGKRKPKRAEVVAWTTKMKYRGAGTGTGVLEMVCEEVKKKGGDGVEFADEHANSKRALWSWFNGSFERREQRARKCLAATWEQKAGRRKR